MGCRLTDPNQVCELKIQDVVIPRKAGEYLIRVAGFIDELLEKVYKLPPYYKATKQEDMVGQLIFGLAPHTCACILGTRRRLHRPQPHLCASCLAFS